MNTAKQLQNNIINLGNHMDLPEPPVPADFSLAGYSSFLFDTQRFLNSEFVLTAEPAAIGLAVMLWSIAWQQIPCGSLPDDDAQLARLTGFGRDVASFRALKEAALRGFAKCSDGRLYHSFLIKTALAADEKRQVKRANGLKGGRPKTQSNQPDKNSIKPTGFEKKPTASKNKAIEVNRIEVNRIEGNIPPLPPAGGGEGETPIFPNDQKLSNEPQTVPAPPEGIDLQVWQSFEQHRVDIKKPLTPTARNTFWAWLTAYSPTQQRQIVDKAIRFRHADLEPLTSNAPTTNAKPKPASTGRENFAKAREMLFGGKSYD